MSMGVADKEEVEAIAESFESSNPQKSFVKHDQGKPRTELLPPDALLEIARVLTIGAVKYGDDNWKAGAEWSRYYGAAVRHLFAWKMGENLDNETGLSHLAHASCCLLFLIAYQQQNLGRDNR